jgi:large subunit ribosomal protein L25
MFRLKANLRTTKGKKVKSLRKQGLIPAVIYGHGIESRSLVLKSLDFQKIYQEAGESNIVELIIDEEKPVNALIQAVQVDPLEDKVLHVDFHQIREDEKVEVEVDLNFTGESKAVKELGGILVRALNKIKIRALPKDLIHEVEVDISKLATFDDIIHISDLKIPSEVEILEKPEEVVATVQPPREEEEVVVPEEVKMEEIERVGEKKKPEEEEKISEIEEEEGKK